MNPSNVLRPQANAMPGSVWQQMDIVPRAWQAAALPKALTAIHAQWHHPTDAEAVVRPIVQAVMGAGKSVFLAAVARSALGEVQDAIVVTAPRTMLVRQLSRTLGEMLPLGSVGVFHGPLKQPGRRVIVACDASAGRLAESLSRAGRRVGLWIADECHGSEAERMKEWCRLIKPRARLGLTATPRRASDKEALTLWSEEIHRYDASQALRDGVVVPFELRHWHGPPETDLDDAITEMIHRVHQEGVGPGVVDASSIEDATQYAARLSREGIRAEAVHCNLPDHKLHKTLRQLRDGILDIVVHVSILKEGVDFPWLRWLGLRRQVSSKVYFAQHVGRVLRADTGKEKALILDPGDLFSRHKLNLEAILEVDVEPERPRLVVIQGGRSNSVGGGEGVDHQAVSMDSDASQLRSLLVEFQTLGLCKAGPGGAWRDGPPTAKQIETIEKCVRGQRTQRVLSAHPQVKMFRRLYKRRHELTKGQASDLLSVLFALGRR